ncbi:hypothetical protein BB776_03120 [Planococcus salinarum]|uniref:Uncharacterized protein n=1 Tax=Planococcus salinarum TaxID=622695 RepID=A0ABX3D1T2_9BACL|nr:hypothetical protein [Planococcus salinarum]OHX51515.1 hypothetical protein BB776_03120 [Planococcus salinarum]TAA71670.1 hypothetical protein D2909_10095 [Planococcus salinarum]
MEELEQQILLFSTLKAFGIAFAVVTIIYWAGKSELNYFKYLLRTGGKGFVYGFVSVIAASMVYVASVIISSLLFGTDMEYYYMIYIVAGLQYIFLAVGWVAAAVQEVDKKRTPLWKVALAYIAIISAVSLPLTLAEWKHLTNAREAAAEVQEAQWKAAISEFGQSVNAEFDFDGASRSIINGEQVNYTISVIEINDVKAVDGVKSSLLVEMAMQGEIRNKEELQSEIQRIARESAEEKLRNQQRQLNEGSDAVYQALAEKYGIDPATKSAEPVYKELELMGVRNDGDTFRKEVDFEKADSVQYGQYFALEMDFREDTAELQEKVVAAVFLLDRLGWTAADFILFSDSSGMYQPVKVCTMSQLEKREALAETMDFRVPAKEGFSIYDQSCEPMFSR